LQAGGKEEDDVRYPKELKQKVLARMMAPEKDAAKAGPKAGKTRSAKKGSAE
jgi:hypothetical protein